MLEHLGAGRSYFFIVGAASVAIFLFAFRYISPVNPASGLVLGFVLGEALALAFLPAFLAVFQVELESRFPLLDLIRRRAGVEVKEVREALPIRTVKRIPLLSRLADTIERRIEADVIRGGMQLDAYSFAARYSFYSVILAAIFVPISLLLSVLVSPSLLALIIIPAVILYTPSMKAKNTVAERRTSIRDELPFFALLASIMQSAGLSLYNTFVGTIGKRVLPATEMEARVVQKSVGFGKNAVDAIDDLGTGHPDDTFKHFLYGYTSVLKSGGDLVLYLDNRAREYLEGMRFRWQRYAQTVGTIGEGLIIVFLLLPLLLVVGSVTMPPDMVAMISYAGLAALPMIALVMYFTVKAAQPRTYDILNGDARLGLIGLVVAALATSVTGQPWLIAAVSIAVGAALYGLPVRAQLREVHMIESALPGFLRDVAEYRKIGYDIRKAVLKIAEESRFNQVFDSLIARVTAQLRLGVKLGEVQVPMRSWLSRMTFFILDQIMESGGGTPLNVEDLYGFISSYNQQRKEATASVSLYRVLGYAVPVAIPVVVKALTGIIGSFGSSVSGLGFFGGGIASIAIVNSAVALITVSAAGAIAFTMTRATDFTAKNTLNIAVLLSLAVLSVVVTQYLPGISLGFGLP